MLCKAFEFNGCSSAREEYTSDARQLRYEWFDEMMKRLDADVLLTHHLDDRLETIFYRLFTGRSTRSTLGIDVQSIRNHYTICRPLLEVSKEDIRDYRQISSSLL